MVPVLQFRYAATEQLKQLDTCMGFVIFISIMQADPIVPLLLFLPLTETQSTLLFQSMICNVMYYCKLQYRLWLELYTHWEPGAMQNNGKQAITSDDTASQNFMADLVTQLLLNASPIILGLAGMEENESEVACIFRFHPA